MSAILALSASHLAWETNDSETEHLAYHHRGVALKGLHEAIGSFSRDNSEAILAASMLLSWQATEWYVSKHLLKFPKPRLITWQAQLGFSPAGCLDSKCPKPLYHEKSKDP
jgi:hypothetical protein